MACRISRESIQYFDGMTSLEKLGNVDSTLHERALPGLATVPVQLIMFLDSVGHQPTD